MSRASLVRALKEKAKQARNELNPDRNISRLTKREWVAVELLQGMLAADWGASPARAVKMADEMLKALEEPHGEEKTT